ncbi:MAG: PAS domain S-box protein [Thermodesulfobacteriota bacterium]|nr:PAS domain S-box protein [Thermodesulfobacteriota bacterium]
MQKPGTFSIISTILVLLFILFAVVHWNKSLAQAEQRVQEHARIVANSTWNLNLDATTEYLKTVAIHYDYKSIIIDDTKDQVFTSVNRPVQSRIDSFLIALHLIPETPLLAPIVYKNHEIGHVHVIWRNKSIYTYFYSFLLTTLLLSTIYLYLHLLQSNRNLEKKVQKRTRTLQESEQKFRAIFDNHFQLTGLVSPKGILKSANPSFLKLMECQEEDIIGMPLIDCPLWSKDSPLHEEVKQAVLEAGNGTFIRRELHFKNSKGNQQVIDFSLKPVFDENNELIYIVPEGRDITALKQVQKEKIRQKQFTDALIESLPGIFYVCNEDLQLIKWNRSVERLSGYSSEELKHKSLFSWFAEEDQDLIVSRLIDRQQNIPAPPLELTTLTKDGSRPVYLFSSSMIEIDGSKYLIGTGLDISDHKKMETELRQAQKMEAIGTLAGGIAHDFNNILSAIIGYTELSQLEMDQDSRISGFLAGTHQAALRARDLVQQILAFSRKQDNSDLLPLQIAPLIDEALQLVRSSIPATININTDIGAQDTEILADPTQIHQVIVNLCTNGYQAIGENTGTLEVSLHKVTVDEQNQVPGASLPKDNYVRIRVGDSGTGMNKETIQRIFEPYFTTKETGKGTGLGLALVNSIVQEHKGAITVDSTPGKGSLFSVYLPIITKKAKEKIELLQQPNPTVSKGHHIVCVDDEPYILNILSDFFHELGCRTTSFESGAEALKFICTTAEPVDLVITDMTMPNMSGLELGRKIFSRRPRLPVILCTGYSRTINREQALEEGFCRYIEKPVILAELASDMQEVLAEKKLKLDK